MQQNQSQTPPRKCPLLECMSIIGGAWTPNILRYLRGGPRRFSELRMDIPQISPKVLTRCLRELEDCGVVERRIMPTSPPSDEYSLNDLGRRLVHAIEAIATVSGELKARQADSASGARGARNTSEPQTLPARRAVRQRPSADGVGKLAARRKDVAMMDRPPDGMRGRRASRDDRSWLRRVLPHRPLDRSSGGVARRAISFIVAKHKGPVLSTNEIVCGRAI